MKLLTTMLGLVVVLVPFLVSAQSPNTWRGLTLDKTTIKDAVAVLGKPSKRKEKQKLRTQVNDWLDKSHRYTKLEFKKPDGLDKVTLYFLDGTLRVIDLDLKEKINPNSLEGAYGLGFVPKVSGIEVAFNPEDYERNQGKIYPKNYPVIYRLIGVAERAYVVATIGNSSFGSIMKDLGGISDQSYPGKVEGIQLISTTLRDARGIDVLR